jgi:hypothetical protein
VGHLLPYTRSSDTAHCFSAIVRVQELCYFAKRSVMPTPRSRLLSTSCRALLRESKSQSLVRKYGTVSAAPAPTATPRSRAFEDAIEAKAPRNNWTKEEIKEIYDTPLMKLAFAAVSWNSAYGLVCRPSNKSFPGHSAQEIPQSCLNSDVHINEHQNRRMQRRLLIREWHDDPLRHGQLSFSESLS